MIPSRRWLDDDGELYAASQAAPTPAAPTDASADLPLLSSPPTLYAPTVAAGSVAVTLPLVSAAPTVFALLSVSLGSGPQSIVLARLNAAPRVHALSIVRPAPAAGGLPLRELLDLSILSAYPTLGPLAELSINTSLTAMTVDSQIPGGFATLRVGRVVQQADATGALQYVRRFLPEPTIVEDMAHVTARFGGLVVFEGVVVSVDPDSRGFTAQGYGLWAPQWGQVTTGGAQQVTSGVVAREAIRACPWLVLGQVDDPGVLHAWSEYQDRTSADILSAVATEGGATSSDQPNTPWVFTVFEDRLARFVAQTPPDGPPRWLWSYDPTTMQIGWDYSQRIDAVRTVFKDTDGARRVTPWFYRPGVDQTSRYLRRAQLTGTGDANTAVALALTELHKRGVATLAGQVTLRDYSAVALRAGDWAHIEGYGDGLVTHVSHDLFTGVTTAQLGNPTRQSFSGLLQRLDRMERATTSGRDPVTGGRQI